MTKGKLVAVGLAVFSVVAGAAWQTGLIPLPPGACPPPPACVCGN